VVFVVIVLPHFQLFGTLRDRTVHPHIYSRSEILYTVSIGDILAWMLLPERLDAVVLSLRRNPAVAQNDMDSRNPNHDNP